MVDIKVNGEIIQNIEGVIFDKDGTLTDSHVYWSEIIRRRAKKLCDYFNLPDIEYVNLTFVMGLDINIGKLMPEGPIAIKSRNEVISSLEKYLESIGCSNSFDVIVNVIKEVNSEFRDVNDFIKPINECISLVKKLKGLGVKIALLTSDTTKNAISMTDYLEITNYFDLIQGTDGIGEKKSSGKSALEVCDKMSVSPQNVISIGDTEVDYIMSQNSKLGGCILVSSGQVSVVELQKRTKCSITSLDLIELL